MVFLDENFLVRNWVYLLATGTFIALRRVIEFLEILGFPIKSETGTIIFNLIGLAVITLLVQLGYYWYRLIYSALPPSK
jgi:hypothetical protein